MSAIHAKKTFLTGLVLLACLSVVHAQYTITGFTPVVTAQSFAPYTISGGSWSTADHWSCTNCTLNGTGNSSVANNGTPNVSAIWSASGTLSYYSGNNPTPVATYNVTAYAVTNNIEMNANAEFFPDYFPFVPLNQLYTVNLQGTAVTVPPGNVIYEWQISANGSTYTNLPNGNTQNYTLTQAFSAPITYIQRTVIVQLEGDYYTYNSQVIQVMTEPAITPGAITPASAYVMPGGNPGTFTAAAGTGGTMCGGNYTYTWQSSTDGINWTTVGTGATYSPGAVSQNTWLRVLDYCGPMAAIASAAIYVYGNLQPGTIGPLHITVASGTNTGMLFGNPASGGDAAAGYTYTWQYSIDDVNWTSISGTNSLTYTPSWSILTTSPTWFRRMVSCNGQTAYSNASEILIATPTAPTNVIKTRTITAGAVVTLSAANALTALTDVKQENEFYDGMGRLSQTVNMLASLPTSGGNNVDLIEPESYDATGRKVFDYLPYPSVYSSGSYDLAPSQDQQAYNASVFQPQGDNLFYYGQIDFEQSPLARMNNKTAPGDNWTGANRGNQAIYTSNTAQDQVLEWVVTNSGTTGVFGSYSYVGVYPPGTLAKTIALDEDGHQVIVYKDWFGNVLLKKVQYTATTDDGSGTGYTGWLCTYYIYDILNELRCVVQPQGVVLLSQNAWNISALGGDILNKQCFRYEYDARKRIIMKQVPSLQPEYIVYDDLDRVVMTQNGVQRSANQWTTILYETALDRPVATGIYTTTTPFSGLLPAAYNSSSYPFTLSSVPSTGWELLTETHYDDYTGIPAGITGTLNTSPINMNNFYSTYNVSPTYAQPMTQVTPATTVTTKGLVTWTEEEVRGSNGGQYIETSTIYDNRARVIQEQTYNYTRGLDLMTTQYNFAGLPVIKDTRNQLGSTQTYEVATRLTYDALERPLKTEKMLIASVITTPAWETISTDSYDALGRMASRTLGNNPVTHGPLETQAIDYNVRGWVLGVNRSAINSSASTPYFGFEMGFDKAATIVTGQNYNNQQYNGNVSGTIWKNAGDQQVKRYDFTYDDPNRLMAANFTEYTSGAFNTSAGLNFTTTIGGYDANGNIQGVTTMGWKGGASTTIDQLTYNYITNSNQLLNVIDPISDQNTTLGNFHYSPTYTTTLQGSGGKTITTVDYQYDYNGNLQQDKNKDIQTVGYDNTLNLPTSYTIAGSTANGTVSFVYDAHGNKLAKTVQENGATVNGLSTNITTTTTYLSGFVYKTLNYSNSSLSSLNYTNNLQFFGQEEGRVRALYTNATSPNTINGLAFDYFLRDHTGNTRAAVTEESETDPYPTLTFEGSSPTDPIAVNQNVVWDNALGTSINVTGNRTTLPVGFSGGGYGSYCGSITKSQGAIGAAKILRVMAGDQLNFSINYTYSTAGGNNGNANGLGTLTSTLANMILGSSGAVSPVFSAEGTASALQSAQGLNSAVTTFFNTTWQEVPPGGSVPEAYLHVLFFNDQFVFDNVHSMVYPITASGLNAPGSITNSLVTSRDGYAYVYFSNESNTTVYFDNFMLTDVRGPLLETTDYYPYGLTMAATSGTAMKTPYVQNKYRFGGKEMQNQEFSNGSGLEAYDFGARFQDPQLGVWHNVDPMADQMRRFSPYSYTYDNPLRFIDPDGMDAEEVEELNQWVDQMNSRSVYAPLEDQSEPDDQTGPGDGDKKKKTDPAKPQTQAQQNKDKPKTPEEQFVELLSKTTGYFALSSDAIKELGGFDKAMELLKAGKFKAEYNGVTKVWSLSFFGNKTVSGSFVAAAKSDFELMAKAGNVIHAGLETTSKIFGWIGVATSVAAFIDKPTKKNGMDVVMSGVAFVPVVGWMLSGSYFIIDQTIGWDKVMQVLDQSQYEEEARKEHCNICLLPH
jgi:RHS repeat-associated protein